MLVRLASLRPLYNESWYWLADVTCVIKATLKEANANCRRRISSKCLYLYSIRLLGSGVFCNSIEIEIGYRSKYPGICSN